MDEIGVGEITAGICGTITGAVVAIDAETIFCCKGGDTATVAMFATGIGSGFISTTGNSAVTVDCGVTAAANGSENAYTSVDCVGVFAAVVGTAVALGEDTANVCDVLLARPTRFPWPG